MRALATAALALALAAAYAVPAAAAPRWTWPVRGPLLARFDFRPDQPFARGHRRGVDIAASAGAPVVAACAGTVRFAGAVGTSGRTVSMACGPYVVSYLHLDAIATRRGARLEARDGVGTVGTTGRRHENRAHLSFGVRRASDRWGYVDPLRLLPGGAPAPPALAPAPRRRGPVRLRLGPAPDRPPARVPSAAEPERAGARGAAPAQAAHAGGARRPALAPHAGAPSAGGLPLGSLWLPAGVVLALAAVAAPLTRHALGRAERAASRAGESHGRPTTAIRESRASHATHSA
jgi:hypothetical protein